MISFSFTLSKLCLYIQHHLTSSKSSERAVNHESTTKVSVTKCGWSYIPNQRPLTKATELVPILLRAGSNVNAQRTNDGFSALHVAAMVGRLEVANLLLQVVFYCWLLIVRFSLQTYQMMHRLKEVESDCLIPSRQEQTQPWKTTRAELQVPSFNLHRHLCIFLFGEKKKLKCRKAKSGSQPIDGCGQYVFEFL